MTKVRFLSCLKKRDYLNVSIFDYEQYIKYGQLYEKEGFLSDAIDFFAKAKAQKQLEALLPKVVAEGDVFLFKKIYRLLKIKPDVTAWKELGEVALKVGKLHFALEAFQTIGDEEKISEIKKLLEAGGILFISQLNLPFIEQKGPKVKEQKIQQK
jgi:tetratricopeptide (TPR) repeat protein